MNTDGGALETLCRGLGVGDLGCDLGTWNQFLRERLVEIPRFIPLLPSYIVAGGNLRVAVPPSREENGTVREGGRAPLSAVLFFSRFLEFF